MCSLPTEGEPLLYLHLLLAQSNRGKSLHLIQLTSDKLQIYTLEANGWQGYK